MTKKVSWLLAGLLAVAAAGPLRFDGGIAAETVPASEAEIRLSFAPIVKLAAPAVVNVYDRTRSQARRGIFDEDPFFRRFGEDGIFGLPEERAKSSLGSGVIVEASGVVVTNNHVVAGASDIKVALQDGREFKASLILRDERSDLAILRIEEGRGPFPTIAFAYADRLQVGDLVLAIGNPFGVGQTVTSGIVSALARTDIGVSDLSFIQTDAAINPGNSGGALVDVSGKLIGVNTAIFSRSGGSNGIGFAIPANIVEAMVGQALAGATSFARPWIGASLEDVTPDIAASLGIALPRGALVVDVTPDSPAAKAGLAASDVIVAVEGAEIAHIRAFDYRLAVIGLGKPARVKVRRSDQELELILALVEAPQSAGADERRLDGPIPLAGATVANLSPRLAETLGVDAEFEGVVVVAVDERSPAGRLELEPGDVILAVQGERIESTSALAEMSGTRQRFWRLSIARDGRVSNIVVRG